MSPNSRWLFWGHQLESRMMKRVGVGIALAVAVLLVAFLWPRHRAAGGKSGVAATASGGGSSRGRRADPFSRPKSRITGHVRDASGKPIATAQVCAHAWSEELSSNETRVPLCASAKADGAYEI